MPSIDIKGSFEILKSNWANTVGLIAGQTLGLIVASIINSKLGLGRYGFAVYALFIFGILFKWLFDRYIPKTKNGKIGFLIAIYCSDAALRVKVKEDFIYGIRRLFKDGVTGDIFDVIILPERVSSKIIDIETATKYRSKYRAHYLIWGQAKPRMLRGKKSYVINLNGQVAHKTLPPEVHLEFTKEFSELLPKMVGGPEDNELLFFEFTSDLTEIVSKYIIGIAALLSGDLSSSETLLKDVHGRLQSATATTPVHEKLLKKIPFQFNAINFVKSVDKYYGWKKTRRDELLDEVESLLEKIGFSGEFFESNKKNICGNLAIIKFLKYRDVHTSIKLLHMIPKDRRGGRWHFSMAFLRAYKGDMKKAYAEYCHAEKLDIPAETISEIEEFILYVLEEEPKMSKLYFCLGIFNQKIKGDLKQAIEDFKVFVEHADPTKFQFEITRSQDWIDTLKREMETDR